MAFVLTILVSQFVVGFTYHGGTRWPIISYPMYSGAKYEGDRMAEFTVYAVSDDGSRRELLPQAFGMSYWIFLKNVLAPALQDSSEVSPEVMAMICRAGISDADTLEIYDIGVAIGKHGPVYGEPELLRSVDPNCEAM